MAVATDLHRDFLIPEHTFLSIPDNGGERPLMDRVYSFVYDIIQHFLVDCQADNEKISEKNRF